MKHKYRIKPLLYLCLIFPLVILSIFLVNFKESSDSDKKKPLDDYVEQLHKQYKSSQEQAKFLKRYANDHNEIIKEWVRIDTELANIIPQGTYREIAEHIRKLNSYERRIMALKINSLVDYHGKLLKKMQKFRKNQSEILPKPIGPETPDM